MTRHSWMEPNRFDHKTERVCSRCEMVKVSRHESGEHWTEFWRDGVKIADDRTPVCEGVPA